MVLATVCLIAVLCVSNNKNRVQYYAIHVIVRGGERLLWAI